MTKGVYILVVFLENDKIIRIGSLGKLRFAKGHYAYSGSAMGGLEQRIRRHLRKDKRLHWHIDYLLEQAEIIKVGIKETSRKTEECITASQLFKSGGIQVYKFGSSDCSCKSHLLYCNKNENILPKDFKTYKDNELNCKS